MGQSSAGSFSLSLSGNFSLWPLTQTTFPIAVVVAVAALWTIVRDPTRGFIAAILASLLLAPYTGLYSASVVLLIVRPALVVAPLATRVLALTASLAIGLVGALGVWAAAGLVACVAALRGGGERSAAASLLVARLWARARAAWPRG
jgi:hypothetical protein